MPISILCIYAFMFHCLVFALHHTTPHGVTWRDTNVQEKRLFPSAHLVRVLAFANAGLGVLYLHVSWFSLLCVGSLLSICRYPTLPRQ